MKVVLDRGLYPRPLLFNIYKPPGPSSNLIISQFKKILPKGMGRVGHFGTLDPFASGILVVGVAGGSRLNDQFHSLYPKSYIAVGKLGEKSLTGDNTHDSRSFDKSEYLEKVIREFSASFIEEQLRGKFLGAYWQAPPAFSAAKFAGRPLHEWARKGEFIPKEKVARHIFDIKVIRYHFPYLVVEVTASSGTYIRSLFEEFAQHLGTYGMLCALMRHKIGPLRVAKSLRIPALKRIPSEELPRLGHDLLEVFPFPQFHLDHLEGKRFSQGNDIEDRFSAENAPLTDHAKDFYLSLEESRDFSWALGSDLSLLGLGRIKEGRVYPHIVFN